MGTPKKQRAPLKNYIHTSLIVSSIVLEGKVLFQIMHDFVTLWSLWLSFIVLKAKMFINIMNAFVEAMSSLCSP